MNFFTQLAKLLCHAFFLSILTISISQAQGVIYLETFDSGLSGWTTHDVDGRTPNAGLGGTFDFSSAPWIAVQDTPAFDSCAVSTSWYDPAGASDDWLVSQPIAITSNTLLRWQAKSYDGGYPDDYEVWISTSGSSVLDMLSGTLVKNVIGEAPDWTDHEVHLDPFGFTFDTIYIGFRNISNDAFVLGIDNVKLRLINDHDASLEIVSGPTEYKTIPFPQLPTLNTTALVINEGTQPILPFFEVTADVYVDGSIVYRDSVYVFDTLLYGDSAFVNILTGYTPSDSGHCFVDYAVNIPDPDDDASNNFANYEFLIDGELYARDEFLLFGAFDVEFIIPSDPGPSTKAVTLFDVVANDKLTSLKVTLGEVRISARFFRQRYIPLPEECPIPF